jgi:hypothetical protein
MPIRNQNLRASRYLLYVHEGPSYITEMTTTSSSVPKTAELSEARHAMQCGSTLGHSTKFYLRNAYTMQSSSLPRKKKTNAEIDKQEVHGLL